MSRWQQTLATAFNVRLGEGEALSQLALHSFFAGLSFVFFEIAAYTLFLSTFGVESLPYVYIVTAAVAATTGALYSRCERALTPFQLFRGTLGFVVVSLLVFTAAYYVAPQRWLFAALMVWKDVFLMLLGLEFWGFAGCVFNVRQGKRLFPVAASGALVAGLVGGLMVGALVKVVGTGGLLVVSVAAGALTLATGFRLTRRFSHRLEMPEEEQEEEAGGQSLAAMLRRPYLRLFFAITIFSLLAYYTLDYVFYVGVAARYPEEAELATFFGYFYALMNLANLLLSGLVSGRLIARFGVGFALCALPVVVLLGASSASAAATFGLPVLVFFWLLVGTKLWDEVLRESLEEPAFRILYQPLPARERLAVQAKFESLIEPIAAGLCGVLLLVLTSLLSVDALALLIGLVALCGLWVLAGRRLRAVYTTALAAALSKRRLGRASAVPADATSLAILERGLRSEQPAEAIYCFQLLEDMGHPQLDAFLLQATEHPHHEVRLYALEQIESRGMRDAAALLRQRLSLEQEPRVRGQLVRALCAVAEDDASEAVLSYLSDPQPEVRRGALIGLLRSGGIGGVMAAGTHLNEQLASPDPADRCFATEVLGEVRIANFYRPLLPLLEDESEAVRRAAVRAAGKLGSPPLLPAIVALAADADLREAAAAALVEFGEAALPELQKALVDPDQDADTLKRLIRATARIGGPEAIQLLRGQLHHPSWSVQSAIYAALSFAGYRARDDEVGRIEDGLRQEAERAAWCWAACEDLSALEPAGIVCEALRADIRRCEDNLLLLLSCLYPSVSILAARRGLRSESSDTRAQALEILDNLVGPGIKGFVVALLDDFSPGKRISVVEKHFPQPRSEPQERLRQILRGQSRAGLWTRLCALYVVGRAELRSLGAELDLCVEDRHEIVRETARWARARL